MKIITLDFFSCVDAGEVLGFVEKNDNGEDEKNVENEMMHWCDRHLCLFIVFFCIPCIKI